MLLRTAFSHRSLDGGARVLIAAMNVPPGSRVLDLGAGSGALAASVLGALANLNCAPAAYRILEVSPALREEHLPVFDCAFKPKNGVRSIHYMGHVRMMGAVQPFISGAISKTVNMPNECTVADIRDAYVQAWKMGLKCVAIYRDGSKRSQPLNTRKTNEGGDKAAGAGAGAPVRSKTNQQLAAGHAEKSGTVSQAGSTPDEPIHDLEDDAWYLARQW